MKIRHLVLFCLSAPLLAVRPVLAAADPAPQVVQGEVSGFDYRAYRFSATAGQYYRIELDNKDVDFSLLPVRRGAKVPSGAEGYIPEDGEYELRVLQKRDAAQSGRTSRYQLTLTVNNSHSDSADAASYSTNVQFTSGKLASQYAGRLQGEAQDSYRFYGNAGDMLRVQVAGDNLIAALHYLGKGHDTLNAAEQVLPEGGQYELRLALNRAAARRGKAVEYRVDITLEGRTADAVPTAPPSAVVAAEQPAGAQETRVSPIDAVVQERGTANGAASGTQAEAPPATPAKADSGGGILFITYRCADGQSYKVHYADLQGEARATFYLGDAQHNLAASKRHSTPAQAVFYGKSHYLVLNTPAVQRDSQIMQFFKRNDEGEAVLAANCTPQ